MLSVILTILKIIGIVLAVLIGLVLLIVVLVGFVPIRYKGDAEYPVKGDMNEEVVSRRKRDALMNKVKASDEKEDGDEYGEDKKELPLKAGVVVSWLLHIVHISVKLDSTGMLISARLFGIFKLYSNDPETVKKKEEKQKKKEEKQKKKEEKEKLKEAKKKKKENDIETEIEKPDDEIKENKDEKNKSENKETEKEKDEKKKDNKEKSDTEKIEETENDEIDNFDFDEESEENESEEKGIFAKIAGIPKKIKEKINGIREKFKNIKGKISSLNKKKNYILDMKDDERVRSGIAYGKAKLFLILKRLKPKKFRGRVAFGMEDPATTGKILGTASAFYPLWGGNITLEPDFNEKKIEADVDFKGKIVLALLVIPAIKVWFNKDIKYIRRKVGKLKKM